ncbi:MAG: L,D-transpeptidase family protein [Bacillota bacterium]
MNEISRRFTVFFAVFLSTLCWLAPPAQARFAAVAATVAACGPGASSPALSQAGAATQRAPAQPVEIVVDTRAIRLTLYSEGRPFKSYPVAVGQGGLKSTPVGEWTIIKKDKNWGRGFGTRWLGLNVPWGIYGIHGTNKPWSIGQRASSGCIRMHNRDVEELYDWVAVGTPVRILGPVPEVPVRLPLQIGSSGKDVLLVQDRLRSRGLHVGKMDARFGKEMADAIRQLQRSAGLPETGVVDEKVLDLLGLKQRRP